MVKKLAIISTHPIQYYAPVFQLLAKKTELKVFYTLGDGSLNKFDKGFGKEIEWDLPLLDGYEYEFSKNSSKQPGTYHFSGIINPDLIEHIKIYAPQAILIYGWAYSGHLNILRYFKGKIPIYFRGDSTLFSRSAKWKAIFKTLFLKWVYRQVDMAFYVGTANKAYFKKYGLKEKQLIFAPHAIDNERFGQDRKAEARLLREKLGIGTEEILILFAGKFDVVKNPMLLLDAFIQIGKKSEVRSQKFETELNVRSPKSEDRVVKENEQRTTNSPHLLFVGNGELEESLKAKAEGLAVSGEGLGNKEVLRKAQDDSIKKRIHFMDFQNQTEMPVVYQACDLFCLPSISETWGLAVNEAMACGKAILVSDQVGCAVDLVQNDLNGAIFESGNLNDLMEKMRTLCYSKTQLISLGRQSKNIIKHWSFENQAESILNAIYKK